MKLLLHVLVGPFGVVRAVTSAAVAVAVVSLWRAFTALGFPACKTVCEGKEGMKQPSAPPRRHRESPIFRCRMSCRWLRAPKEKQVAKKNREFSFFVVLKFQCYEALSICVSGHKSSLHSTARTRCVLSCGKSGSWAIIINASRRRARGLRLGYLAECRKRSDIALKFNACP